MLDRPPPPTVLVRYDRARVDDFIEMADCIEERFPQVLVEGEEYEEEMSPEDQIHVSLNGERIAFSAEGPSTTDSSHVHIPILIKNLESILDKLH
jgi:hypothetical protein